MSKYDFTIESDKIIDKFQSQAKQIQQVSQLLKQTKKQLQLQSQHNRKKIVKKFVKKKIWQGSRGGLYYINVSGNRTYLSPTQCKQCKTKSGSLKNTQGCPPLINIRNCPQTKKQLHQKIKDLNKKIKDLNKK